MQPFLPTGKVRLESGAFLSVNSTEIRIVEYLPFFSPMTLELALLKTVLPQS